MSSLLGIPQEVLPSSNSNNMQGRLYRSLLHASIAWMSRMSRLRVDGGGEGAGPALWLTCFTGCVCRAARPAARVHRAAGVSDGAFWQLRGGGPLHIHLRQHLCMHSTLECTAALAEYAGGHVIPHIQVLKDGANKDVAKELKAAVDNIPTTHAEPALAECRDIVMKVSVVLFRWSKQCGAAACRILVRVVCIHADKLTLSRHHLCTWVAV